jgi:hypothetical protein
MPAVGDRGLESGPKRSVPFLVMEAEGWDMHDVGAAPVIPESNRLAVGQRVSGVVVCHHHFGLGVRLHDRNEYGHVDIPQIAAQASTPLRGPADYPPIGVKVEGRVLGYSGDQLRLTLREG